jgi:Asp-tRNA(Asn)/Glu-tRNA(Gln) amidotransferase A subunit family amidase
VIDRRAFIGTGLAVAARAAVGVSAQAPSPETLSEWLKAPRAGRDAARQRCLERIRSLDPSIQAWVQVSPQAVTGDGPLAGIPFGAKDIMETRGLSTEYGSPIYKGRMGTADAAIVTELRKRGAVLLGKTHTTAFAYRTPAPTRNPRNPEHTPGGSSSGSAAAVAAGMVPLALGTQTRGSVLRPASYCGVTGFKVTYGRMSLEGVLPLAKSLDTLGFFTHTPDDMLALWGALGNATSADSVVSVAAVNPMPRGIEPAMAEAFQQAVARLRTGGVFIRSVDLAALLARVSDAANTVMFFEGAQFHRERYEEHGDRMADMADLVRKGLQISQAQYDEARGIIAAAQRAISSEYESTPIILAPAATGPAPAGLTSTGDAEANAPWTALGTPAVSIPMPVGKGALPLGLQVTADRGQDAQVLRTASWLYSLLAEPT